MSDRGIGLLGGEYPPAGTASPQTASPQTASPQTASPQTGTPSNPLDPNEISLHGGILTSQPLGNLGTLITYGDYTTAFVSSSTGSKGVVVGGRIVDPSTGNVIYEPPQAGSSGAATQGQLLTNQSDQARLAEDIRQFNEKFGYDKARGDQQQRVSEGNLAVSQGNLAVNQGQLSLQQAQQAYKQYSDLANLASNPRNYVQTFFMNRGVQPPSDVARYANTTQNASNIMPFSQFLQQQGQPLAANPNMGQNNPVNPYAGTNINYGGSKTTADVANINGVQTWAGGPYAGRSVASSPANAGDLTPYLKNPAAPDPTGRVQPAQQASSLIGQLTNIGQQPGVQLSDWAVKQMQQPRQFARGGTLHMTGPHAVVDMITGQVKAIAGEAGPENAHFDGAVILDPGIADPYNANPQADPYSPPTTTQTPNDPSNPYSSAYNPYDAQTTQSYGPQVPTGYGPVQTQMPDYSAIGAALAASANAANPNINPIGAAVGGLGTTINQNQNTTPAGTTNVIQSTPYVQPFQPIQAAPAVDPYAELIQQAGQRRTDGLTVDPYRPEAIKPGIAYDPTLNPQTNAYDQFQQQFTGGNIAGAPTITNTAVPSATNPQNASVPGSSAPTFGQPIPSTMPTYLAGEDFQGSSPILRAMQQSGAVAPFLSRAFAQARGDSSQGTNVPQTNALPPDLPLLSSLAWTQLSPSEQQAFLSYVSALGVDPNDYLNMISQSSPTGSKASAPTFGSRFSYTGG